MINENEFEVLVCLEKEKRNISQREISKITGLSLGTVNKSYSNLINNGLIGSNGLITDSGVNTLEPYRVKRAIFLAAGFGSRMVPITLNTPKPLVLVNGKKIIEDENFKDKKFVITGSFDNISRDEIKEFIEERGGLTSDSVSKKTDVVLVGEAPGSKRDKAIELNIPIWNQAKLFEIMGIVEK